MVEINEEYKLKSRYASSAYASGRYVPFGYKPGNERKYQDLGLTRQEGYPKKEAGSFPYAKPSTPRREYPKIDIADERKKLLKKLSASSPLYKPSGLVQAIASSLYDSKDSVKVPGTGEYGSSIGYSLGSYIGSLGYGKSSGKNAGNCASKSASKN